MTFNPDLLQEICRKISAEIPGASYDQVSRAGINVLNVFDQPLKPPDPIKTLTATNIPGLFDVELNDGTVINDATVGQLWSLWWRHHFS